MCYNIYYEMVNYGGVKMIRIIINTEVGNLTELKMMKIGEVISKYFPNGVNGNNQIIATKEDGQL